jgi:hypothetical protein
MAAHRLPALATQMVSPLVYIGGGLQVAGYGTLWREASRTLRREIEDYVPLPRRAWRWLGTRNYKYLRKLFGTDSTHEFTATVGQSADLHRKLIVPRQRNTTARTQDQINWIHKELDGIRRERDADLTQAAEREAKLRADISQLGIEIRTKIEEHETERKRKLRRELRLQQIGIFLFIAGIVLSVIGAAS